MEKRMIIRDDGRYVLLYDGSTKSKVPKATNDKPDIAQGKKANK